MAEIAVEPTDVAAKSGWLRKLLVVLVPLLIIGGLVGATMAFIASRQQPEETRRPFNTLAVMADYAVRDDVRLEVLAQGETRPQIEIDLVPEVGGKIVYVSPNFVESGRFSAGETLIRIDPSDYEVGVVRAKSGLAQAMQAEMRERAEADLARKDFEELGVGEPSDLALRVPQMEQARAAVQAAEADVSAAELQLQRTEVRAPFSGRVRTKSSDLGQFVNPGTPLGRVFSTGILEVRLPLTDSDLAKLDLPIAYVARSRADAPEVTLHATIAGQRQEWAGRIMRTDSTYDTQTRALFAIVEVADPYGKGASDNGVPLAPGLFVDATIPGKAFEDVIVLPRDGLRPQDQVYVVDMEGRAEARDVSVIDATPERAILRAGTVEAGELVVLSPLEPSRLATPLKVLDINDPKTVLVEPKRPDADDDEGDEEENDASPTPSSGGTTN